MADCASGVLQARALEYVRSCSASSHRRGQRAARRGVARLLTDAGIEVTARSGTDDELLVRVAEYPPDAVVVDIRLPPPHTEVGMRAALTIRQQHPGVGYWSSPSTSKRAGNATARRFGRRSRLFVEGTG
jgi:hypothetical protein